MKDINHERRAQVTDMVQQGLSTHAIARKLEIAPQTVSYYRKVLKTPSRHPFGKGRAQILKPLKKREPASPAYKPTLTRLHPNDQAMLDRAKEADRAYNRLHGLDPETGAPL